MSLSAEQALIFVPLACLSISLSVASVWGRMTTQRKWREWLTKHLLALWLKDDGYRRLKFVAGEYKKNAEYRISFDARIATDVPVDMALRLGSAGLTAIVFIDVLWAVGGSLTITVGGHEVTIPGYLVLGVGLHAFVFTMAMTVGDYATPAFHRSCHAKNRGANPAAIAVAEKAADRINRGLTAANRDVINRAERIAGQHREACGGSADVAKQFRSPPTSSPTLPTRGEK
jgi:hypothetical protein